MLFYLVGPIQYVDDYTEWRMDMKYFLEKLGHKVLLPWGLRKHRKNMFQLDCKELMRQGKYDEAREIVAKERGLLLTDISCVLKADYLIVYLPSNTKMFGTSGEVTLAFYLNQYCGMTKKVLIITDFSPDDFPLWILGCSDVIFKSFEDCKSYIQKAL